MKSSIAPARLWLCLLALLPASGKQTKPRSNPPSDYADAEGYKVLSSIIDARTSRLKNESVSIFHQTISISEDTFKEVSSQCSGSLPDEFKSALENFDKKAKTRLLLQRKFSIHRKYDLVRNRVSTGSLPGTYSMSAVGFDAGKTHAIVLIEYLVGRNGSMALGGDSTLYLLRKGQSGWQEVADVPKCGLIY